MSGRFVPHLIIPQHPISVLHSALMARPSIMLILPLYKLRFFTFSHCWRAHEPFPNSTFRFQPHPTMRQTCRNCIKGLLCIRRLLDTYSSQQGPRSSTFLITSLSLRPAGTLWGWKTHKLHGRILHADTL